MYEGFNWLTFIIGLPLGLLIVFVALFIQKRILQKKRAYDERYTTIQVYARSTGWQVTTGAIIIAWIYILLTEPIGSAFFVITFLWIAHQMGYLIGAIRANAKN